MSSLSAFSLTKLRVPLGGVIGDNNCSYSAFDVCAVRLEDADGLCGWGFGEVAARLADEYDLALIGCNTFGEHGIHYSLTNPRVERIEFAGLGWNELFENPVRAVGGRLVVPDGPGLALTPRQDRLRERRVED